MKVLCLAFLACMAALAQAPQTDPCSLLKLEDITTAVGPGFRQVRGRGGCNFVRRGDSVLISSQKSTMGPAKQAIPLMRNATPGAKAISGSCDAAFERPSGSVLAGKGIWLVTIAVQLNSKLDPAAGAKLASLLCSRM